MTEETSTVTDLAAELRGKLVDELCEWEPFRAATVENAMRTVPRHLFLPGFPVEEAYSHGNVVTHRDLEEVAVSSASSAGTVAGMLQQLEVRPGDRVLEIGAGTGYNAALLARLAGPEGEVTTVDINAEVAEGARRNLNAAGSAEVQVICGDGEDGYPAAAPFDRIIVTAGAWDIPPAWLEQLAPACSRQQSTVPVGGPAHHPDPRARVASQYDRRPGRTRAQVPDPKIKSGTSRVWTRRSASCAGLG